MLRLVSTMASRPLLILLLAFAALAPAMASAIPSASGDARPLAPGAFSAYVDDGRTRFDQAATALPVFDAMFEAARQRADGLRGLPIDELRALAEDAHAVNFYFAGARPEAHREIVGELLRRSKASDQALADFHAALVAARRWEEARAFSERFPALPLETLPELRDERSDAASPAVLRPDPSAKVLVRQSVVLGKGAQLVVVSHPDCGFSRRAIAALESDDALDRALPARRLYLAPTFGRLGFDRINQWNAQHPRFPHVLVDRPAEWTFIQTWATPQFLFLVDGKLVEAVTGWPGDDQAAVLLAAAQRVRTRNAD